MKTSVSQRAPRLVAILALALATLSVSNLSAQNATVTTVPVGAVGVTIAAGTGTSRALSTVSFPLVEQAVISGKATGIITGVTASTLSNSTAGWTAGQLSTAAAPCLIQITSGSASGRTFLVSTTTASTATTVTLDAEEAGLVDLTTLGISAGVDTYRVLACDTLSSIFGTPTSTGVLGAATNQSANGDIVLILNSGSYRSYYYNTTSSQWARVGPNTASNNVAIRPDAMVIYNRLKNTALGLTLTGEVPSVARKAIVKKSGLTVLANGWPAGLTLATSGIQNSTGWTKATPTTSDTVQLLIGTSYQRFYHNGTNWRRVGPNTISDNIAIPVGSGVIISKLGSTAGSIALSQALPYSL
jgi:hypothetical protein